MSRRRKIFYAASALTLIIGLVASVILIRRRQQLLSRACHSDQSALALCLDNGHAGVEVSFTNTDSCRADVVAEDSQTHVSVDLGTIQPGQTKTGSLDFDSSSIDEGSIVFKISWGCGWGERFQTANYSSIACPLPTPTPAYNVRLSHLDCEEALVVMTQAPEGLENTQGALNLTGPSGSFDLNLAWQGYFGGTAKWSAPVTFTDGHYQVNSGQVANYPVLNLPTSVDLSCTAASPTPTPTRTLTPSPSPTRTPTRTPTPSLTPTRTPSPTPHPSATPSPTPYSTGTPTRTPTPTVTPTPNPSTTLTPTQNPTPTPVYYAQVSPTISPSLLSAGSALPTIAVSAFSLLLLITGLLLI
jgi:hypothetical protein